MMCLADETQVLVGDFLSCLPPVHMRTSVRRPGRVFCGSKIWKGEKAARGSRGSGG